MAAEDFALILGMIGITAYLIKIIYYYKAKLEKNSVVNFLKVSISYLGIWVLLPVRIRDDDSEKTRQYKRISNIATIIFYSIFIVLIVLAVLNTPQSNIDYRNIKNEFESKQRK